MKKAKLANEKQLIHIASNVVEKVDLEHTDLCLNNEFTLKESENFNRTLQNTEIENMSLNLALAENIEQMQGRNFDGVIQPLSARNNDNPDLCDRLDHDKMHPVTSNEDINQ